MNPALRSLQETKIVLKVVRCAKSPDFVPIPMTLTFFKICLIIVVATKSGDFAQRGFPIIR